MLVKSLRKNAVFVVLVLATTPLVAQPAPTPSLDPAPADGTDPGAALGGISADLTIPEMQAKIVEFGRATEEDQRHVLRLRIAARKDKDVIKLNCLNDKFLQIKALLNIIEAAWIDFDNAVTGSNIDEQHYQYTRISTSAENIRQLREEANACAGEIPDDIGDTDTGWTGPDLPDDPQDPFGTEIEPPGYASPYN
jgi:hypothetical protein